MKQVLILIFTILIAYGCGQKAKTSSSELTWLTVEEASEIGSGNNDKKFLVDVYTDWCGWCKVMDKKTFTDPEVIKYLNEHFHVVKFDAEQKEALQYRGKTYNWESMGRNGINSLALELLQGRMSYPTLVYLNANLDPIMVSPGYKEPSQLLAELKAL
jgi:thioredoxin-related protein